MASMTCQILTFLKVNFDLIYFIPIKHNLGLDDECNSEERQAISRYTFDNHRTRNNSEEIKRSPMTEKKPITIPIIK